MNIYLLVLLAYSVLLIAVGLVISRRVSGADDFLVAGRSLSPALVFATFLAANIGAGSTVGAAGRGYQIGLSAWWWVGSAGIGSIILAFTVGPRIWRIAKDHNLQTVGDYLALRFGRPVRGLIAVLMWFGALALLAGQLIAISLIMTTILGSPKWLGAVIGGVVVAAYFSAGGLLTSAWVNAIQLVVMLAGFLIAVPVVLSAAGGWTGLTQAVFVHKTNSAASDYLSIVGMGASGVLGYLVLLVPSFIVSPGLIQKLFGARDASAVRIGIGLNAVLLMLFAFGPPLIGMVAFARFPALSDPELALPTVMLQMLPPWLGLLALAAVFSAEVSTCDAILFMLSSSLSIDLYKTYYRPTASESELLRVSRVTSVVGVVAGVGVAILLPSIIAALSLFYGLLSVALFVPLVAGLYWKAPGLTAALVTIVVSVGTAMVVQFVTSGKGIGIMTPVAVGIAVGAVVMVASSMVVRQASPAVRRSG